MNSKNFVIHTYSVRLERKLTGSVVHLVIDAKTTNEAMDIAEDKIGKPWVAVSCNMV